jgi:hypothetical protein
MDFAAEKCILSRQERPERIGFARLRGFLCESIRGLVPDNFTISRYPLETGKYALLEPRWLLEGLHRRCVALIYFSHSRSLAKVTYYHKGLLLLCAYSFRRLRVDEPT